MAMIARRLDALEKTHLPRGPQDMTDDELDAEIARLTRLFEAQERQSDDPVDVELDAEIARLVRRAQEQSV